MSICAEGSTDPDQPDSVAPIVAASQYDRVGCAESPWDREIVLVQTRQPLVAAQAEPDLEEGLPWALELEGGQRCVILSGATTSVAGMRLNYDCGAGEGNVVGEPDRTDALWEVFFVPEGSAELAQVSVVVAWY